MIKAYLLGIKSLYEGESIEVKYRVFDGDKLIIKKTTNITKRANVLNSPNIVSYVVNTNNVNIVVELSPVDIEYIKGLNKSEDIFKELFINNFNIYYG